MRVHFLLMLTILGFQTVCHGQRIIHTTGSYTDAINSCKSIGSKLACMNQDDSSIFKKNGIQSVWLDTFSTFSSWIKPFGCGDRSYLETLTNITFQVINGDIGTCEIYCRNFSFFGVEGNRCMCFNNIDRSPTEIPKCTLTNDGLNVFERVHQASPGLPENITAQCSYLFCNGYIPKNRINDMKSRISCTYETDQIISICGYPRASQECIEFTDFEKHIGSGDGNIEDIQCKAFQMKCTAVDCHSVEFMSKTSDTPYFRVVGFTSTQNYDNNSRVITCTKANLEREDGKPIVEITRTKTCEGIIPFFCEKGRYNKTELCNLEETRLPSEKSITKSTPAAKTTTNLISDVLPQTQAANAAYVAGIVVGTCLIVVAVLVIIIFIRKRKQHEKNKKESQNQQFCNVTASNNPSYEQNNTATSDYDYIREPEHYISLESRRNIDSGYEEPGDLQNNYFILEPKIGQSRMQTKSQEDHKECDYIDAKEGDYDRLHGKEERKPQLTDKINVYSHGHTSDTKDMIYDKTDNKSVSDIDESQYDTTCASDDDYNKLNRERT